MCLVLVGTKIINLWIGCSLLFVLFFEWDDFRDWGWLYNGVSGNTILWDKGENILILLWVIKQNRIKWGQVFIHRMCELIFSPFRIYWEKVCVIAKSAILSVIFFLFDLILGNFLSLYIAEWPQIAIPHSQKGVLLLPARLSECFSTGLISVKSKVRQDIE